jgi:DNA processing protein
MPMTRREAFLALTLLPRVGPVTLRRLLAALGSPEAVLAASPAALQRVEGIGPAMAKTIHGWEQEIDLAMEKRRIRETGAGFVTLEEDGYPELLREIHDPPPALYVLGELQERDRHAIAVVGSRRSTHYGNSCARKLSFQLAGAGLTVVSGLARGIDTAGHEGALEAKGRTLAVIGCGLGKIYPPENADLARRIADGHGAVLSEFPIDQIPDKTTFPLRNRIVSGLSRGILVVECPAWSGALITANLAAEHNRSVYAVPGPIDRPSSAGCHKLIQDGAKLVTCADDIIEDFLWLLPAAEQSGLQEARARHESEARPPLEGPEAALYDALAGTEAHIDELIARTGFEPSLVSATLLKMEFKRLVKQLPGKHFTRLV